MKLFNTLSGRLETFEPLKTGEVRMYTCGPTVYDFAHIGNFRTFVFEDLLRRVLEFKNYKVRHVMNITDVDDKTILGANREGVSLDQFTAKYIAAFQEDCKKLNILPPHEEPRATQHIPDMLNLVNSLMQKGVAYEREGSVYYRVSKFPNYGKLSKKNLAMNQEGARVDVDEYDKEEGADFVLWKKSKEGEPSWDSPWGKGRPGWHLECSAMSMKYLGETFDIHAGGEDLIFPHHENEIAQSEGVTGKTFVKYWLHSKFLLVDGEKMSKSKGNFYTLRDLLDKGYDPMAIRYALISTHYRTSLNFTLKSLEEAKEVINKMDHCYWGCFNEIGELGAIRGRGLQIETSGYGLQKILDEKIAAIESALSEDLNISKGMEMLLIGVNEINKAESEGNMSIENYQAAIDFFHKTDSLFGFDIASNEMPGERVLMVFDQRDKVRCNENFLKSKESQSQSDQLRKIIEGLGWEIKDRKWTLPSILKKKRRAWDK